MKIIGLCRMTKDCDLRAVGANNTILGSFSVAYDDGYGDHKKTVFLECKAWGKKADFVGQYLGKGSKVYIEGVLQSEEWEDKNTGQMRRKNVINVLEIQSAGVTKRREEPQQCEGVEYRPKDSFKDDYVSPPSPEECPF